MSTTDHTAHVRLGLSSRAENVQLVRQALRGLADATGLTATDLNDIETAVTEACSNASMHAYGHGEGSLEVELLARDETMVATVRDRGVGLALDAGLPVEFPPDVNGELSGIGVPSIKALTRTARWSETPGGGTEVEMIFSTASAPRDGALTGILGEAGAGEPARPTDAIEAWMAPLSVACCVLPRLLRAVAARARFSVERHADAQRALSTVLSAAPSAWIAGGIQARLIAGSDSLEVAIGPTPEEEISVLTVAAQAIEPDLGVSTERLSSGRQRLVLHLWNPR